MPGFIDLCTPPDLRSTLLFASSWGLHTVTAEWFYNSIKDAARKEEHLYPVSLKEKKLISACGATVALVLLCNNLCEPTTFQLPSLFLSRLPFLPSSLL
jgi:hypothetical protein